jgi:hypothetical protein
MSQKVQRQFALQQQQNITSSSLLSIPPVPKLKPLKSYRDDNISLSVIMCFSFFFCFHLMFPCVVRYLLIFLIQPKLPLPLVLFKINFCRSRACVNKLKEMRQSAFWVFSLPFRRQETARQLVQECQIKRNNHS